MRFIQISLALAGFSTFAGASVIKNGKRSLGLEVTLVPTDKVAEVIATVKNVGAQDLNLLTLGSFLDSAPVQKLAVVDEASKTPKLKFASSVYLHSRLSCCLLWNLPHYAIFFPCTTVFPIFGCWCRV
jgi:hypothetical protein